MKKKAMKFNKVNGAVMEVTMGVLSAIILSTVGIMIGASLMNREVIGEEGAAIVSLITWALSALCGTMVSGKMSEKNTLTIVVITAVLYMLLLVGLKCILFNEPFSGIGKGILMIILGSIPSILLFCKQKTGKKIKFKYSPK